MSLPSEVLESACLAAAAGGFGTLVCMANTVPPIDRLEQARALKRRAAALGLADLFPALSLTKNMEGTELSEITRLPAASAGSIMRNDKDCLLVSEDGKDLANDALFLAALGEARRAGVLVSCHCDFGGEEEEAAKRRNEGRAVWSRIGENNAVRRVIDLGKKAGCRIHIAHVSTKEAVEMIRWAKAEISGASSFALTCEAMPHNIAFTEERARELGGESFGRVNPPLRSEEDRQAVIAALADGTIDAIATDHAPHTQSAKAGGAPGFSGLETAFAAVYTELVLGPPRMDLRRLSALMSARPARLLGLGGTGVAHNTGAPEPGAAGRGRIEVGMCADLVVIDCGAAWTVDPETFKSRGKNSAFAGKDLRGRVLMTLKGGRVVFEA
jgi:dihydroorotase